MRVGPAEAQDAYKENSVREAGWLKALESFLPPSPPPLPSMFAKHSPVHSVYGGLSFGRSASSAVTAVAHAFVLSTVAL